MPVLNHTHSYVRWKTKVGRKQFDKLINGEASYRCAHPDCTHYTQRSFLVGKHSACPRCGSIFTLDSEALTKTTPMCLACRDTKEGRLFRSAKDLVTTLFTEEEGEEPNA